MNDFIDHLKAEGFEFSNHEEGKFNRCSVSGSSKSKKPAWFVYRIIEGKCFGAFGDHRDGITNYWPGDIGQDSKKEFVSFLSEDDKKSINSSILIYEYNITGEVKDHYYLYKKKVDLNLVKGLIKSKGDTLVLPLYSIDGEISGIQHIEIDGSKKFVTGTRQKGSMFFFPSENKNRVIICEGWATGYSIWASTKDNVCVAWSAGNIYSVSESIRKKHPEMAIVIAADNDQAGLTAAEDCKTKISKCSSIVPKNEGEDFNDVFVNQGEQEVKNYFFNVSKLIQFGTCYREAEWFLDPFIESGAVFFIVAPPKAGKSFFVLYLALAAANNALVYNNQFSKGGGDVLYVCGEDFNSVNIRVMALCHRYNWDDKKFMITTAPVHFLDKEEVSIFLNDLQSLKMVGHNIRMIIVDTLNRNYGNGSENDSMDMTKFFNSCQKIFSIFPDVSLGIVHHTGHEKNERARGSSVITGSLNTEMLVNTKDDVTYITCKEQKNAKRFSPLSGRITTHNFQKDGKNLYSAVFEEISDKNLSETQIKSFAELRANDN